MEEYHKDFDGILHREGTQHNLPLGWLIFFIGVILWGIWYMFVYVPIGSWSQSEEYSTKVAAEAPKDTGGAPVAAANPYKGSSHEIEEGGKLYAEHCAMCHGDEAEGGMAPPLAGVEEYIYGGTDAELLESVMEGRPGGMPPFGTNLGEKKAWEILAYIDSLGRE